MPEERQRLPKGFNRFLIQDDSEQTDFAATYRLITSDGFRTLEEGQQVGDLAVWAVATVALAPFLQAVATVVGTRAGERLDDATRTRLRRLLRRRIPPRPDNRASMLLTSISGKTRIQVDVAMPEGALPLLLTMTLDQLEAGSNTQALVRWTQAGWLATVSRSQQLEDLIWNAERQEWTPTVLPVRELRRPDSDSPPL
ncbi:hypothetical protein [Streptomyces sp. NPDC002580]|uniref:hypothetical protein n=1 Tax=Streptomyces sp. NPDC002580 TaxID=3364653 RepID=UPI0036A3C07D